MTTRLCVAPEDVMALLDDELTGTDARMIQDHLEECSQCALLAEQLRGISEPLSRWTVSEAPRAMDSLIKDRAKARAQHLRKRWIKIPPVRLALAGVATAVLGVIVLVTMSGFGYRHARMQRFEDPIHGAAPPSLVVSPAPVASAPKQTAMLSERKRRDALVAVSNGVMNSAVDAVTQSPMIARVMSMTIVVKNVDSTRIELDAIIAKHHGYSAQESVNAPEYDSHSLHASLRVPAGELTSAEAEIARLGKVVNESQTGEEVSEQHADLMARLKTAKETEARFQAILQQRTGKVSDVLEVEQNIARLRGEIEAMEAEQKGLEHRVAFATIDVDLRQEYKAPLQPQADSSSTQLHNAFVQGYRNVTDLLFGILLFTVSFGPPLLVCLLIVGGPGVLMWRRHQRRRGRV